MHIAVNKRTAADTDPGWRCSLFFSLKAKLSESTRALYFSVICLTRGAVIRSDQPQPQRSDRRWVNKSTLWIRLRHVSFPVVNSSEVCWTPVSVCVRVKTSSDDTHTHTHTHKPGGRIQDNVTTHCRCHSSNSLDAPSELPDSRLVSRGRTNDARCGKRRSHRSLVQPRLKTNRNIYAVHSRSAWLHRNNWPILSSYFFQLQTRKSAETRDVLMLPSHSGIT